MEILSGNKNKTESSQATDLTNRIYISVNTFQRLEDGLKYTFQHNDGRRLNRDGVLTVYNFRQPVEIPVTKLIGKWKESFAGVTVVTKDGKWRLDKEQTGLTIVDLKGDSKLKTVFAAVKKSIVKHKPAVINNNIISF